MTSRGVTQSARVRSRRPKHDYVALVEVGAEAAQLQAELEAADREATSREVDTAALLLTQMNELAEAVKARIPADQ